MPRIPSAAEVAPVGAARSRVPAIRAAAADFGLATAEGLSSLGDAVAASGPLAQRLEMLLSAGARSERAAIGLQAAAHRTVLREAADRMVAEWDDDDAAPIDAARRAARDLKALEERWLDDLPPAQRDAARQAAAPVRQGHGLRTAQRAQNLRVAALARRTGETLDLLQRQAAREPQSAARYAEEGGALLDSLHDAGALTRPQLAAERDGFRRGLAVAAIRARPAAVALTELDSGAYDALLDDAALKQALLMETTRRRESEGVQGAALAEAMVARARRGEAASPELGRIARRLLDDDGRADLDRRIEIAEEVRAGLDGLRFAPAAALQDATAVLAVPEDLDTELRTAIEREIRVQAEELLRERARDPAGYAMGLAPVAEAFAAVDRDAALLPAAVTLRLAAQAAMGLAPEQRRALSDIEGEEILSDLRVLPARARVAALRDLARRYGDAAPNVAAELAEAGLSPAERQALEPGNGPGDWARLSELIEAQERRAAPAPVASSAVAEAADRRVTPRRQTRSSR